MFNIFFRVTQASFISFALLSSSAQAIYEEDIKGIVRTFRAPAAAPAPAALDQGEDLTSPPSSSMLSTMSGILFTGGSYAAQRLGSTLRWAGDRIREDGDVAKQVVTLVAQEAALRKVRGHALGDIANQVEVDESVWSSTRNLLGNVVRGGGALLAGETPTIARDIRNFWIQKRMASHPDHVFTSTVAGFVLSGMPIEEMIQNYNEFSTGWNRSSQTTHQTDENELNGYYIRGLVRGFIKNPAFMGQRDEDASLVETVVQHLVRRYEIYGVNPESLLDVQNVTAETVLPDAAERGGLTQGEIERRVSDRKIEVFTELLRGYATRENDLYQTNLERAAVADEAEADEADGDEVGGGAAE